MKPLEIICAVNAKSVEQERQRRVSGAARERRRERGCLSTGVLCRRLPEGIVAREDAGEEAGDDVGDDDEDDAAVEAVGEVGAVDFR